MDKKQTLSFSNATLKKLKTFFDIEVKLDQDIFKEWFNFEYKISGDSIRILDELINTHRSKLAFYQEEKLKAKFIIPILNLVYFYTDKLDDWYEMEMSYEFDHVILKGVTDFLVAKGTDIPETPFFFLQEFKYTYPDKDPKYQLLAEMIAALEQNPADSMKGCFVVGAQWFFTLLQKKDSKYYYYISQPFEALIHEKLYQIFINLQAVKAEALAAIAKESQ